MNLAPRSLAVALVALFLACAASAQVAVAVRVGSAPPAVPVEAPPPP